jgi:glycosyltransferase involved in cell wall biosynthesis
LVTHYLIDSRKISVVENGVDAKGLALRVGEQGIRKVRERFGLTSPYVVYFGALERTKNVHLLIEAFCQFLRSFPDYRLVITGRSTSEARTGYGEELRSLVGSLQISHRVTFSGYVDASDLPNLIAGARMLAFPSEAEGFGFPPLEALACSTPAVSADTPVSREVYGDAVLRADPNNPAEFSQQMQRLARDEGLRDQLLLTGRRQLQLYRWDNVCRKLLDIYRQVASGKASGNRCEVK